MRFIYTKAFGYFSLCVVLAAALVLLQVRGWIYPLKNLLLQFPRPIVFVAKSVTVPTRNFIATIYDLKRISRENAELNQKVYQQQQDLVRLDQETKDNEALRKELGFAATASQQLVPCTVLSKNPFDITDTLVLNCGRDQGIKEGQAVVSQGYMVGKVIFTDHNLSSVQLITNSGFSTDAKISKTGTGAIVRGSYGSGLVLDQLPQDAQADKGMLIVTAGINSQIPKNILIGEIGDVLSGSNDLFKKVTLLNPIDLESLDFVFVVK